MEKLNLFGIPLSAEEQKEMEQEKETSYEKQKRRKIVNDLISVIKEADNQFEIENGGGMQDFDTPKSLVKYDIDTDSPNFMDDMQHMALKYEDRLKLRASIIIDAYASQLAEIDQESLSSKDRESMKKVV